MKLSKESVNSFRRIIENRKGFNNVSLSPERILDLFDTIDHLLTSINTLADKYEAQGRVAEAKEVRGLVE